MLPIGVTTDADSGIPVIAVRGDIDIYSAPEFDELLQVLIEPDVLVVVIDLTETPFIDSSGLTVLVRARNRGRETHTEVRIVAPEQQLFEVTGLSSVFAIFKTLGEALEGQ
jgi:anti-sigma B factor antagonist